MSDLLIKGMEMPKKYPVTVTIFPDGISVAKTISGRRFTATAAPVPPHGRAIDASVLMENCMKEDTFLAEMLFRKLNNAPTIIEAEEVKES